MTRFSECLRRGRGRLHCDGWNNVDAYFTFETLGPYLSLMLGMCTGLISPVKRSPLESPDDSLAADPHFTFDAQDPFGIVLASEMKHQFLIAIRV